MLFMEYPPCGTCKKARKWLEENGVEFTARHIKEEQPTLGRRSSMPQPKTRPDSPVPSLQGPCDRSLKSEEP